MSYFQVAHPLKDPVFHNFLPALLLLRTYPDDKEIINSAITTSCFLFALWGPLGSVLFEIKLIFQLKKEKRN